MAKCRLRIVLDREDATYRPFEPIEGRVLVTVDEPCACRGLVLKRQLHFGRADGSGFVRTYETQELFAGDLAPDREHAYPFSLTAPGMGLDFEGELLVLTPRLEASADVPWALDPTVTKRIRLVPHDPPGRALRTVPDRDEVKEGESTTPPFLAALAFLIGGLALGGWAAHMIVDDAGPIVLAVLLGLVGVAFAAFGAGLLKECLSSGRRQLPGLRGPWPALGTEGAPRHVFFGRRFAPRHEQAALRYDIRPSGATEGVYRAAPGPSPTITLASSPALPVKSLEAGVVVQEQVRVHERDAESSNVESRRVIEHFSPLAKVADGLYRGALEIPAPAPYSAGTLGTSETGIRWDLHVRGELEGEDEPWTGHVLLEVTAPRPPTEL